MRYTIGPPYLLMEPIDDSVTTLLPSHNKEKRLTETKAARNCKEILIEPASASLGVHQLTGLATGATIEIVK